MKLTIKILLVPLFLLMAFPAAFCQDTSYISPEINFIYPANGSVIPLDTESVTVQGVIIKGTEDIDSITVNGDNVPFDQDTLEFTYTIPIDSSRKFHTYYFDVQDSDFFIKSNPYCLTSGEKHIAGSAGVVDNALRLNLTGNIIEVIEGISTEFINNWKYDIFYGWNGSDYSSFDENSPVKIIPPTLPIVVSDDVPGTVIIDYNDFPGEDKQGMLNFGHMKVNINVGSNGQADVSVKITPEYGVQPGTSDKALYLQGYHKYNVGVGFLKKEVKTAFKVTGRSITISGGKVIMDFNNEGQIEGKISFANASINIDDFQIKYGALKVPTFLKNLLFNVVKETITQFNFDVPVIDTSSILIPETDVIMSIWPGMSSIYEIENNNILADIGAQFIVDPAKEPLNPALDHFLSTPYESLPVVSPVDKENIIITISDDMVNQAAYTVFQLGLFNDFDITNEAKEISGQLENLGLEASATLGVPPICRYTQTGNENDLGKLIVRNIQLHIKNYNTVEIENINATIGLKGEFAYNIEMSEDGQFLMGTVDFDKSNYETKVLFCNVAQNQAIVNNLNNMGNELVRGVVKKLVNETIKFKIPELSLYGTTVFFHLLGNEIIEGNSISRIYLEHIQ